MKIPARNPNFKIPHQSWLFAIFAIQISIENVSLARKIPIDGVEGGQRKVTAKSTWPFAKVSPVNRLPVLRSVIVCRADTELAEEIPKRKTMVSVSDKQETSKESLESPFKS